MPLTRTEALTLTPTLTLTLTKAILAPSAATAAITLTYPSAARPHAGDHDTPLDMSGLVSGAASSTWMKRMLGLSYARPLKETEGPQAELRGAAAIKAVGSWQAGGGLRLDSDARGFWLLYDLLTGHLRLCVLGDAAGEASCTSHGMGAVPLRLASPG